METNLRPLNLGELLDRTAQLYRTNFVLFAGIAAVFGAVSLAVNLGMMGLVETLHGTQGVSPLSRWTQAASWVELMVLMIGGNVAAAANNRAVAWVHLGQHATIAEAYRTVLPNLGRYLWLGTVKLFMAWTPLLVVYGAFQASYLHFQSQGVLPQPGQIPAPRQAASPEALMFALVTAGFFLVMWPLLLYGAFMALRYALAVPASVVENLKTRAAIRRSIELSKGARGKILVLWILALVIEMIAGLVTQSFFVGYAWKHHFELPIWLRVVQQFLSFLTNTFVAPILATGTALFYYDQRIRKEGFDIEWMMAVAGMRSAEAAGAQTGREDGPGALLGAGDGA